MAVRIPRSRSMARVPREKLDSSPITASGLVGGRAGAESFDRELGERTQTSGRPPAMPG